MTVNPLMAAYDDEPSDTPGIPSANQTYGVNVPKIPRRKKAEPEVIAVTPAGAIIPYGDDSYQFERVVITPVGLQMPDDLTFEEWNRAGQVLNSIESAIQWNVGDWGLLAGERLDEWLSGDDIADLPEPDFESKYQLLMARTGYSYQTVRDYAWVAGSVPVSIRNRHVKHSLHRLVAGLKNADGYPDTQAQTRWISLAAENGWTLAQMRDALRQKSTPMLSGPSSFERLFQKDSMPKTVNRLKTLAQRAIVEEDPKARRQLAQQINSWRKWLSDLENEIS